MSLGGWEVVGDHHKTLGYICSRHGSNAARFERAALNRSPGACIKGKFVTFLEIEFGYLG